MVTCGAGRWVGGRSFEHASSSFSLTLSLWCFNIGLMKEVLGFEGLKAVCKRYNYRDKDKGTRPCMWSSNGRSQSEVGVFTVKVFWSRVESQRDGITYRRQQERSVFFIRRAAALQACHLGFLSQESNGGFSLSRL
ncbi:hypothetical protein SRHO_G00117300 [Serrasalmus rhombeus]